MQSNGQPLKLGGFFSKHHVHNSSCKGLVHWSTKGLCIYLDINVVHINTKLLLVLLYTHTHARARAQMCVYYTYDVKTFRKKRWLWQYFFRNVTCIAFLTLIPTVYCEATQLCFILVILTSLCTNYLYCHGPVVLHFGHLCHSLRIQQCTKARI
jgi:hypothetical protein